MSMSNTEKAVKDIRRNTRRKYSTEEKIRIVLDGLQCLVSGCLADAGGALRNLVVIRRWADISGFKSVGHAQRFLGAHAAVSKLFNLGRHPGLASQTAKG